MSGRLTLYALILGFCGVNAFGLQSGSAAVPYGFQDAVSGNAFDQGMQAYRASDWKEAARWMATAEEQAPGKTDALLIQARALIHLDDFVQASKSLRSYIATHTTSSDAQYMFGYSLYKENKPRESLDAYTSAAKLASPKAHDFQIIGLDYVLLNDYPDAIKWLEHAVELDPNNVDSLYALARCYYTQTRFNDAEKKFRAIIQLSPDNRRAWQNLALVCDALNRPDEADSAFRRSIEIAKLDPKSNEWPYLDYGGFLLDHDRAADAIPILQRSVEINPNCAACHEKLGRSLSLVGKSSEAEHELQQAVALDPQNPKMHFELSRVYRQSGNLQKAREEAALSAKLYGTKTSPETK